MKVIIHDNPEDSDLYQYRAMKDHIAVAATMMDHRPITLDRRRSRTTRTT